MAAAFAPQLLRQAFAVAPKSASTSRAFSSTISKTLPSFRAAQLARQQSPILRNAGAVRVAAFHASQPRAILPPLPQAIKGTVNDAVRVPDPDATHGSYHWSFERLMSAALIPLTIAPFASGALNPTLDACLCATLLIHSHIGFEACITDYFPHYRVPRVRKALNWVLKTFTVLVAVGLYEFETNDVGLTAGIARVWSA